MGKVVIAATANAHLHVVPISLGAQTESGQLSKWMIKKLSKWKTPRKGKARKNYIKTQESLLNYSYT